MVRPPVERIQLNEQLNPVASPVDTYVRPARSPLLDLAENLGRFDSALSDFVTTRDRKEEENQKLRGRAKLYNDAQGDFAKLVDSGQIPAHLSPFYVEGYQQARGEKMATGLRNDWQTYWDSWAGKDSDDPNAFDTGFQEFLKGRIPEGTDPRILKGLLPGVEALQSNATTQYMTYRSDKVINDRNSLGVANGLDAVQDGLDLGNTEPSGPNYETIFKTFNDQYANTVKDGDPNQQAEGMAIDAMAAKIIEQRDPELLKWFDTKVPGKDYTWGQTLKGIQVKNQTGGQLTSIANSQQSQIDERAKAEQKRLRDEAAAGIIDGIMKDPNAPFDQSLLEQAKKNGNPNIIVDATNWRDTLTKGRPSDPEALKGFYASIISGERNPQEALRDALNHGVFTQASDLTAASSFVQSFKTNQATIERTMDSSQYRSYLDAMKVRTTKGEDLINPIAGISNEGFEAQSDFRQLVARWILENPNATPQEISQQVDAIGKQIIGNISDPTFTEPGAYQRPDLPFPNSFTGKQGDDNGGQVDPNQDILDWEKANKVSPEIKAKLEEQARRRGVGYEEFIRSQISKPKAGSNMKTPDGTKVDPTSLRSQPMPEDLGEGDHGTGVTKEQAEQWIDQAFSSGTTDTGEAGQNGAQAQALMALIRQGESSGNYNAVYGSKLQHDLSKYSVDQILKFQADARARGVDSTAVGAYGFIYKTLRGLKSELGLSGNEKFDQTLQDKMGYALLERRGLNAFREGRISKSTFALALSQEFAALPNPNTGRSFYDGDGLNKSRVKTSKVYQALGFPVSYQPNTMTSYASTGGRNGPGEFSGNPMTDGARVRFSKPEQEAGVSPQLKSAISSAYSELGLSEAEVTSGFRGADHPVERRKKTPGEHAHGNAVDLNLAGMDEQQRAALVQKLIDKGVKRFITYTRSPNMLHIDLKDQTGDGKPYFMHDRSAANLASAPSWFRSLRRRGRREDDNLT